MAEGFSVEWGCLLLCCMRLCHEHCVKVQLSLLFTRVLLLIQWAGVTSLLVLEAVLQR